MEITLALGGGGVRGLAHIGVIRCLEKAGVHIRAIAGTSAGAICGALYANGCNPEQIETLFQQLNPAHLLNRLPQDGPSLLGLAGVIHALQRELDDCTFDHLKIPFACTAVDIFTMQEIVLRQGHVLEAVLASSAVPGIFPPRIIGDYQLIDGGILDPVPVSLAHRLAPDLPVVAVVLTPNPDAWAYSPPYSISNTIPLPVPGPVIEHLSHLRLAQAMNIFLQSVDISGRMLTELRLSADKPDVIIRPPVCEFGILEKVNSADLVKLGEQATLQVLPELLRLDSWRSRLRRSLRKPARVTDLPGM
jgi:NTE family protein